MPQPSIDTLYRVLWDSLPDTLTHVDNLPNWLLRLKYQLKLAGWEWRDDAHIRKFLFCAERRQVIRIDGPCMARFRPLPDWPEAK